MGTWCSPFSGDNNIDAAFYKFISRPRVNNKRNQMVLFSIIGNDGFHDLLWSVDPKADVTQYAIDWAVEHLFNVASHQYSGRSRHETDSFIDAHFRKVKAIETKRFRPSLKGYAERTMKQLINIKT